MESVRIAGRVVDPSLNRITSAGGATVQVEPKVMSVLVTLAERPGVVVTREELMARVWNGVFVTDDALHRTIRELRRLFDDDADSPRVIETIRKRGYRLIAPVGPGARHGARIGARHRAWHLPALVAVVLVAIAAVARFSLRTEANRADPLRVTFTPFTSDPGNEVSPSLSATGKLAYVSRADDGRPHIFIKTAADAAAVQITRGPTSDYAPTWSADEQQLAFVRTDASSCAITIADARGEHARAIASCLSAEEFRMSWSPDSSRLAVTAGRGSHSSPSHIATIAIDSGAQTAMTNPPPGYAGDYEPSFAPDGRSLAFVRVLSGGITSLCVMPATPGAPITILTSDDADVLGADWDPTGRFLIFSSDRAGAISIWRIAARPDAASAPPELIAGGGNKLKHPTVARLAGTVAYEDWQYEINLRELSTTAAHETADVAIPIGPTADRWNFHPQISPDGRRIAFQSTRSGAYEIWVSARDGSRPRQLTQSRIYKSMPRWSPDSRRLAFTIRTSVHDVQLVVIDADSGAARTLASGSNLIAPGWSHDGSFVRIGDTIRQPAVVSEINAENGAVRELGPGVAAVDAIDGRARYTADLAVAGLARWTRGQTEPTRVVDHISADQWPNWGVYDRGVYYVGYPDAGEPQLFFVETGQSEPRAMTRLPDMAWPGIAVSRDGSRVIYAHADRRSANIGGLQLK